MPTTDLPARTNANHCRALTHTPQGANPATHTYIQTGPNDYTWTVGDTNAES